MLSYGQARRQVCPERSEPDSDALMFVVEVLMERGTV
jgi:hypothetical protein